MQVKPIFASDGVANTIADLRMEHHLGIADCARGEIDKARVIAARLRAGELRRGFADDLLVASPAFASGSIGVSLVNEDGVLDSGTVSVHLIEFGRALVVGDDSDGLGDVGAKLN